MSPSRSLRVLPLLLLAVTACSDDDGGSGSDASAALDGRTFVVTSIKEDGADRPIVEGTEIRISFDDGTVGVQAGCNSIGGAYLLDGDELVVENLSTTDMGCEPALMEQDQWMAGVLTGVPTVVLVGDDLTLSVGTAVVELTDREVVRPDAPLVGTVWVLDTIFERGPDGAASSIPGDVEASVTFAEDGTYGIDTGCNTGSGSYELTSDTTLELSGPAITAIGCGGDVGAVEAAMLAVFAPGEVEATIDDQRLTITSGDAGLGFLAEP